MKKWDFFVCGLVLFVGIGLLFSLGGKQSGSKIEIYVNGELNSVYSLSKDAVVNIQSEFGENTVKIENGQASVVNTTCKDKLEMDAGAISKCGESLICLPNRLVITVSGEGAVDGVSY
ncbi:MAG: NusG domain II-containing protein [Clostridia bacterium]|nr:NusG domain II-containing protein [Clostridia bacterium]